MARYLVFISGTVHEKMAGSPAMASAQVLRDLGGPAVVSRDMTTQWTKPDGETVMVAPLTAVAVVEGAKRGRPKKKKASAKKTSAKKKGARKKKTSAKKKVSRKKTSTSKKAAPKKHREVVALHVRGSRPVEIGSRARKKAAPKKRAATES